MAESYTMDDTDKALLNIIQSGFPIESRPYAVLGEKTGISEEEALERVRKMRKKRIIRRMGANFQSKKLGWVSTLCAAKVPADRMEAFTALVNAEPGVTHNYEREHSYNIWFTFIGPSRDYIQERLDAITAKTGIPILNPPPVCSRSGWIFRWEKPAKGNFENFSFFPCQIGQLPVVHHLFNS